MNKRTRPSCTVRARDPQQRVRREFGCRREMTHQSRASVECDMQCREVVPDFRRPSATARAHVGRRGRRRGGPYKALREGPAGASVRHTAERSCARTL